MCLSSQHLRRGLFRLLQIYRLVPSDYDVMISSSIRMPLKREVIPVSIGDVETKYCVVVPRVHLSTNHRRCTYALHVQCHSDAHLLLSRIQNPTPILKNSSPESSPPSLSSHLEIETQHGTELKHNMLGLLEQFSSKVVEDWICMLDIA